MSGVPFENLGSLATVATTEAARQLLVREAEFQVAKEAVAHLLRSRQHGLPEKLFRAWRRAIRTGVMPPPHDPPSSAFAVCWDAAAHFAGAEKWLEQSLRNELPAARAALFTAARLHLPAYLVFASPGVRDRVTRQLAHAESHLPPRNKQARADERHLLLYLQRICGKNDSLSEFGPEGWGKISRSTNAVRMLPRPGIAERETFLERWTAHGAAAAINADPEARLEFRLDSPRTVGSKGINSFSLKLVQRSRWIAKLSRSSFAATERTLPIRWARAPKHSPRSLRRS